MPSPRLPIAVATAVLLGITSSCGGVAAAPPAAFHATVAYVVDGDTLRVRDPSGELEYVRLVGIDTPEDVKPGYPSECGSKAASRSMEELAPEGATVRLQYDSVADQEDVYGRILAHASIEGSQPELAQLRRGWADVYRYDGQRFDGLVRFRAAEATARSAGRGVWGRCGGDFHSAGQGRRH